MTSQTSENLFLPYIMSAQAQKHVTHNEAIRMLDGMIQLSVSKIGETQPETSPVAGERFIVGTSASDEWENKDGEIAAWQDGAWAFFKPQVGWRCWVEQRQTLFVYTNDAWEEYSAVPDAIENVSALAVGTANDANNTLIVEGQHSLLTSNLAGHRLVINRSSAIHGSGLQLQTGFVGHAEHRLDESNNYQLEVSPNGSSWKTALRADASTGGVSFSVPPAGSHGSQFQNLLLNAGGRINQRNFPGGALAQNDYGYDRWKAATQNTSVTCTNGNWLLQGTLRQEFDSNTPDQNILTFSLETLNGDLLIDVHGEQQALSGTGEAVQTTIILNTPPSDTIVLKLSSLPGQSCTYRRPRLELGTVVSHSAPRPDNIELSMCQNHFQRLQSSGYTLFANGMFLGNHSFWGILHYETKRKKPSISNFGNFEVRGSVSAAVTTFDTDLEETNSARTKIQFGTVTPGGESGMLRAANDGSAYIDIDAQE